MFGRFARIVSTGQVPAVTPRDRLPAKSRGVFSPAVAEESKADAVEDDSLLVFRKHDSVAKVLAHVSGVRNFEGTYYTSSDTGALATIQSIDTVLGDDEQASVLIDKLILRRSEVASVGTLFVVYAYVCKMGSRKTRQYALSRLTDLRLVTLDHWAVFLSIYTVFGNGSHGRIFAEGPAVRGHESHVLGKGHHDSFLKAARASLATLPNLKYFLFKWRHARRLGYSVIDLFRILHFRTDADTHLLLRKMWRNSKVELTNCIDAGLFAASDALWNPKTSIDMKVGIIEANPRRFSRESICESHRTHKSILRALIMNQSMPALALVRSGRALVDSGALVTDGAGGYQDAELWAEVQRRYRELPADVQCLHVVKAWAALHRMDTITLTNANYRGIEELLSEAYFRCKQTSADMEALRGLRFVLGLDVSGSTMVDMYAVGGPGMHNLRAGDLIFLVADMIYDATGGTAVMVQFSGSAQEIKWTKTRSLTHLLRFARTGRPYGCTNPGAAIDMARAAKFPADAVVILTDNDVNSGTRGSCDAKLNAYRREIDRAVMGLVLTVSASDLTLFDPQNCLNGALDKHDATSSRLMWKFAQLVRTRGNTEEYKDEAKTDNGCSVF